MLQNHFRTHKLLMLLFLGSVIIGGIFLTQLQKGDEVLYFNSMHTPLLDQIFKHITEIAETPGVILFLIAIAVLNYRFIPVFMVNLIIMTLVVTYLKHQLFAAYMRPSIIMADRATLNFIPGLEVMRNFSFPSGHTATGFAMCFLFALLFRNTWLSLIMFIVAVLIAISRLYLLQHFYEDVYTGAIVGVLVSIIVYLSAEKWKKKIVTI